MRQTNFLLPMSFKWNEFQVIFSHAICKEAEHPSLTHA
jgi:hypothetical protein